MKRFAALCKERLVLVLERRPVIILHGDMQIQVAPFVGFIAAKRATESGGRDARVCP